jgi:hypothetical protein
MNGFMMPVLEVNIVDPGPGSKSKLAVLVTPPKLPTEYTFPERSCVMATGVMKGSAPEVDCTVFAQTKSPVSS